jgi:putative phosphoesterase
MQRIGLLSDTHGFLDPKVFYHFEDCTEIWHAGDWGEKNIHDALIEFRPVRGVYGNVDGTALRHMLPLDSIFMIEGLKIWMTHIGGYPGHYPGSVIHKLNAHAPDIFICGHSHIVRIMKDGARNNMLTINPGAAGKHGFHLIRTIVKMDLNCGKIENMKLIELGKRA